MNHTDNILIPGKINPKVILDIALCICFVACAFANQVWVLTAVVVLAAAFICYRRDLSIRISGLHIYVLCFTLFVYMSALWAVDPSMTMPKANGVAASVIMVVIMSIALQEDDSVERLLKIIMFGGYLVVFLFTVVYGWSGILELIAESERPDNEILNANVLGMIAGFSAVINLYFIFSERKKLVLLDLLIVPDLVILFVSGSRKALAIIALGIIGVFLINGKANRRKDIVLIKTIIFAAAAAALVLFMLQSESFSTMTKKIGDIFEAMAGGGTRGSNSVWLRFRYIELGTSLFLANPILGIGMGNANYYTMMYYGRDHYLHNNFSEMLACGGLVGFILYYSIYVYIIYVLIKYRKYRTKEYSIVCLVLAIWMIIDIATVKYYSKITYIYLLLFWLEAVRLKKKAREANYEEVSAGS